MSADPLARLLAKVDASGDCWEWTGYIDPDTGYGMFYLNGQPTTAHRAIWELLVGPVGKLVVDHLCRNRKCVNPDHLEPITYAENALRGWMSKQTQCRKGHLFRVTGRYFRKNGTWMCAQCQRDAVLARHYAKKGYQYAT